MRSQAGTDAALDGVNCTRMCSLLDRVNPFHHVQTPQLDGGYHNGSIWMTSQSSASVVVSDGQHQNDVSATSTPTVFPEWVTRGHVSAVVQSSYYSCLIGSGYFGPSDAGSSPGV